MNPNLKRILILLFIFIAGILSAQNQSTQAQSAQQLLSKESKTVATRDTVKLNEVEVLTRRINQSGEKIMAYPTSIQKSHAHDVYGLLSQLILPQLSVDALEKTVESVRGEVLMCINGRKTLPNELLALDPVNVVRIDYYNQRNHPNHPEATEVLDIITLPRTSGGALNLRANQHLNKKVGDYSLVNHNFWKKSELSVGLFADADLYDGVTKQVEESFQFPDHALVRRIQIKQSGNEKYSGSGFVNYSFNNDNKTKASVSLEWIGSSVEGLEQSIHAFNVDTLAPVYALNIARSRNYALALISSISHQFKHDQLLTLDLTTSSTINDYARAYMETNSASNNGGLDLSSEADELLESYGAQLYYSKTFRDTSILTAQAIANHSRTNISYRNDYTADERLDAGKNLLFVGYSKKVGKVSLYGKLGFSETYFQQSDSLSKTYYAWLPTISVDYRINNNSTLVFSEYMYNNTPSLSWQSTAQQTIDKLQVNRGNPHVKQLNSMEGYLAYYLNLPSVDLSACIWNVNNLKNSVFDVHREGDIFVHTYATDGSYHMIMPVVSATKRFFHDRLTTKLTASWARYWLTGSLASELTTWGFGGQFNYTYKNFMASMEYETPQRWLGNGGRVTQLPTLFDVNMGYSYKGARLSLGIRNPFMKQNAVYDYRNSVYSRKETRQLNRMGNNILFATLSYRFSYGKKREFEEKTVTTTTASGILKGEH